MFWASDGSFCCSAAISSQALVQCSQSLIHLTTTYATQAAIISNISVDAFKCVWACDIYRGMMTLGEGLLCSSPFLLIKCDYIVFSWVGVCDVQWSIHHERSLETFSTEFLNFLTKKFQLNFLSLYLGISRFYLLPGFNTCCLLVVILCVDGCGNSWFENVCTFGVPVTKQVTKIIT